MTRLLLDEMLSGRLAERLRTADADVYSVVERASLRGLGDADFLELAAAEHLSRRLERAHLPSPGTSDFL